MSQRFWAILAIVFACGALLFSFQNFTYKYQVAPAGSRQPASVSDFNQAIEEGQKSQKQLAQELEKAHPPEKVGKEGLVRREDKMKRAVIEDTGSSVAVSESKPFFKKEQPKQTQVDDKKNLDRLSQEFESERP